MRCKCRTVLFLSSLLPLEIKLEFADVHDKHVFLSSSPFKVRVYLFLLSKRAVSVPPCFMDLFTVLIVLRLNRYDIAKSIPDFDITGVFSVNSEQSELLNPQIFLEIIISPQHLISLLFWWFEVAKEFVYKSNHVLLAC